jgi:CheY-like chemotaxis protein
MANETAAPEKKTILVVEDEAPLQEAVKMKLEREGYEVLIASSGEEAVQLLHEKRPTLVWLDILLPGMNGIEVLQKIRQEPTLKDLPVVIVSVSYSQPKLQEALALNVIDYIVKSEHKLDDIIKRVKEYL